MLLSWAALYRTHVSGLWVPASRLKNPERWWKEETTPLTWNWHKDSNWPPIETKNQGKWWSVVLMAASSQVWNCSLALPPTPVTFLTCLNQGLAPASPSCLGGGWSSVGEALMALMEKMWLVLFSTRAFLGSQATPAGLHSTTWGAF